MNTIYPEMPGEPTFINNCGWKWPAWIQNNIAIESCPACGSDWVTSRPLSGQTHRNSNFPEFQVLPYPHFQFACGGIWREIDGRWVGKCWARKTRQLFLFPGQFACTTIHYQETA
jgi:hypothetical protein